MSVERSALSVERSAKAHSPIRELDYAPLQQLIQRAELIDKPELLAGLINEADELVRIFAKSIQTAANRRKEEGKLER